MKTIASIALAGIIVASGITSASAWDGNRWDHHYWHHDRGWNPGAAVFGGLALGLTLGALAPPPYYAYPAYPPPPPPPPYPYRAQAAADAHIDWCLSNYNTYNPETDLWIDYRGARHVCLAPY